MVRYWRGDVVEGEAGTPPGGLVPWLAVVGSHVTSHCSLWGAVEREAVAGTGGERGGCVADDSLPPHLVATSPAVVEA